MRLKYYQADERIFHSLFGLPLHDPEVIALSASLSLVRVIFQKTGDVPSMKNQNPAGAVFIIYASMLFFASLQLWTFLAHVKLFVSFCHRIHFLCLTATVCSLCLFAVVCLCASVS